MKNFSCRVGKTPNQDQTLQSMNASILSVCSPKTRKPLSRHSTMPSAFLNASKINLRRIELETTNIDLELAYNDYVASFAELILEKEILKTSEVTLCDSITKLHEETKVLREQFQSLEKRLNDIKIMSSINDYQDLNKKKLTELSKIQKKYETTEILDKLSKTLNRFNVLCCEKVVLPSNSQEMDIFMSTLVQCLDALQAIRDPTKSEVLEFGASNYEHFIDMYRELLESKKIVEKQIRGIQVEVLKKCSHLLTRDKL
ncbi:hypothetical protein QAD02_015428 [Eretmocerus hayati]|uniref:Uncharacterized protein n=1 Tax=Eretmocerus hayati TaxID=131215 RepID=A0ACC2P877_9HYME|nr:hypothetical protein QAD02_015428 [Eretmocerus hayati]